MTINCIAVDDEPLALAQISNYISHIPYLNLVAQCRDAFEATDFLASNNVDLVFVDINMPDINGLEFVRSLFSCPYIIFTTAYSEYAIEGFKVEAVDYLLKPYTQADLLQATEKVRRRIESTATPASDDSIFIKCDFRTVKVRLSDIIYIEGMNEFVKIFIEGEDKPLIPLLSMKRLEDSLPRSLFMRIHKSYIVNLNKVTDIQRQRIVFGNVFIPIGDSYKDRFTEFINSKVLK